MSLLKGFAARLPDRWQVELKRYHFRKQIRKGTFVSSEPEFEILQDFIVPGDWVVDIGANVGYYTKRLSELVGPQGRVIAFEPVPETFSLLAANVQLFAHPNVTLVNAAVSDRLDLVGMSMPKMPSGLANFYQAHISPVEDSPFSVLTLSLDSLCVSQRIALIKIDAEGHEPLVLSGMMELIKRHRPVLVVETFSDEVIESLAALDYRWEKHKKSANIVFQPN
jgi:FkbM family methyltransferase